MCIRDRGRLPTIDTDIVDDPARFPGTAGEFAGWDDAHGDIWTANHPPLFHLAMVPVWWVASDHQTPMIITMRLANTLGFAGWLLLVGLIARELVPRRPAVTALAVVVAAAPTLVLRSAFLVNDGWAGVGALLLLLMTIRMLRGPATGSRVAIAAAAGTLAAGTRAPGVLMVALCTGALLLVVARREGWVRGLGVAAVVGGVPAAAFGWFFLRNRRLYGDLTGQGALLDKFERPEVVSWLPLMDIRGLEVPLTATAPVVAAALLLVPVAGFASLRRDGWRLDPAWVLLVVLGLVTAQSLVGFIAAGGSFHDRYVMQVMPLLATTTAIGMLEVGRWWRGPTRGTIAAQRRDWWVATGWASLLLLWLAGAVAWLQHHYVYSRQASSPVDGPVPDLLAVLAAGAGVSVVAMMAARARALSPGRDTGRAAGRDTAIGVTRQDVAHELAHRRPDPDPVG